MKIAYVVQVTNDVCARRRGRCVSCFSFHWGRKSGGFKYHAIILLAVQLCCPPISRYAVAWWIEATLCGKNTDSVLVSDFLGTGALWCPFLTLCSSLRTGLFCAKLVVLSECVSKAVGTPSPAGSYVITSVFSPATWFGFLKKTRRRRWNTLQWTVFLPSCLQHQLSSVAATSPPWHWLGLCNEPSRTNKGIPHTYLAERRGERNGNLTFPLTLVILCTNS